MSRDISTTEKVRLSWITELRRQGHRQCIGPFGDNGGVCALVLLHDLVERREGRRFVGPRDTAAARAGLSEAQMDKIIAMNDGKCCRTGRLVPRRTFSEIADVVEGWFK